MQKLAVIILALFICRINSTRTHSKRQLYICGTFPNQYYSNTPCTQIGGLQTQAGSKCQNGGTYIGWTCQQASQCRFSTPSGILSGQCVNGLCCTSSSSSNSRQCPSNMIRKNRSCSTDSQCTLTSNRGQHLRGKCRNGSCCVPKLSPQRQSCKSNERRTNRRCSKSNLCQRSSYWVIVTCRNNYCCERDTSQGSGGQPCANPMTQYPCNYDQDCAHLAQTTNQRATCYAGLCCAQQQSTFNPCTTYGRSWTNQQCSWSGVCSIGTCINGYCCA